MDRRQIEVMQGLHGKFSFWAIIAYLLALLTLASSQVVKGEVSGAGKTKYFQIDTEGQWEEIPQQAISSASAQIRRQTDQTVEYLAGYASTSESRTNWFDLPYILITSDEKGKFPQNKLDQIVAKSNEGMEEHLGDLKDVVPHIQVGEMSYEKGRRIIWMEMVSDTPQFGKVHAITAMMLTEVGTLNFILYVASSDRETRLRAFSDLLNQVRLEPNYVYRSEPERPQRRSITDAVDRKLGYGVILLFIVILAGGYKVMSKIISKMKSTPNK
jgi:hypothetical protein